MTTRLKKAALSQYLRTRCDRMLACSINESDKHADSLLALPARPGLAGFKERGNEFEDEFLAELAGLFPAEYVEVKKFEKKNIDRDLAFRDLLAAVPQGALPAPLIFNEPSLMQDRYRGILMTALGIDAAAYPDMTALRPDLIIAMPRTPENAELISKEIRPDGTVRTIMSDDKRIPLRVVDIKFTEQLNVAYAGEVCLYSMVLAAWLEHPDIDLAKRYYVTAIPGVLVRHTDRTTDMPPETDPVEARLAWLHRQIDDAEADLYAPPVVNFFREDLKRVIAGLGNWRGLEWHVTPLCAFCDYLGYPGWSKRAIATVQQEAPKKRPAMPKPELADYCFEDARVNHRVNNLPQLSRGMLRTLTHEKVHSLDELRGKSSSDAVFNAHNGLKIESFRMPRKAGAVVDEQMSEHPAAISGQMARHADLLITIACFFDAATGLLTSLAMGVDYRSPSKLIPGPPKDGKPTWVPTTPQIERKQQMMWVMEDATDVCEADHLLDCLRFLSNFIDYVLSENAAPDTVVGAAARKEWAAHCRSKATVQVAFWDQRQDKAFREAIGRHLHRITHAKDVTKALLWMFPPKEIIPSDNIATSPAVCYVHDVATRLVALPTTVNDDILSVAKYLADFDDSTSPYMWDRVAGVIPKERSLEITQKLPPKKPPMSISQCIDQYRVTLRTLIHAMRLTVFRIQHDHRKQLKGDAPKINDLEPSQFKGIAADAMLWLTHYRVCEGVDDLERQLAYTSEPHELEARYQALRVEGLIRDAKREATVKEWRDIGLPNIPSTLADHHLLFNVRASSRHVKFRNDSGFLVLLPEQPAGAGLMTVRGLCLELNKSVPDEDDHDGWESRYEFSPLTSFMKAHLVHFDRDNLRALIDIEFPPNFKKFAVLAMEGILDLDAPMVLMEGSGVSLFKHIRETTLAIGNPPIALPAPETVTALVDVKRKPGQSVITPAASVLWNAGVLVSTVTDTDLADFDKLLDIFHKHQPAEGGLQINDDQRAAIRKVLSRQLMPVWGGPGTGKTQTLATAIILEILLRANTGKKRQRIYVTGPTYRAVNEVAGRLAKYLNFIPGKTATFLQKRMTVSFVSSVANGEAWGNVLDQHRYCNLNTELYIGDYCMVDGIRSHEHSVASLKERLLSDDPSIELVFSVTKQSYWLGKGGKGNKGNDDIEPVAPLFDRIFVDESSQLSVVESLTTIGLLTVDGRLGLFGDPMQMPPIQAIEPPIGAEHVVGSLHTYLVERFPEVEYEEHFLRYNYRSCEPIVRYAVMIGYKKEFESKVPNLQLLYQPHGTAPVSWPKGRIWWSIFDRILDQDLPCVAVTHEDGLSGQANEFEAALVVGTVLSYRAAEKAKAGAKYDEAAFWQIKVGIVTPHRAQRSTIVERLRESLASESVSAILIEDAVDTVERFQGGERDMILVSFGIGDPDLIRSEEDFLFQRQRINVAISRARAKAVLFISKDLLYHLPEDKDVISASRAIKWFAYQLCSERDPEVLLTFEGKERRVELRYTAYESLI